MNGRARALVAALTIAGAFATGVAEAHPLEEATARISLRDGQLEVLADVDLLALTGADATALAVAPEAALVEAEGRARRALEHDGELVVDGRRVALRAHGVPEAGELRALAAAASAAGGHGPAVRVRLEALASTPGARTIELALPVAVGPALVTFVEPSTRYVLAGGRAGFVVGARRAAVATGASVGAAAVIGVGALALLAGLAAGWALRGRATETA